jgi:hypothetical protein
LHCGRRIEVGGYKRPISGRGHVERAAARIAAALKSGGFETTFRQRFTWWMKFLRLLPQPPRSWFINRPTGWNKRKIVGRQAGVRPDVTEARPKPLLGIARTSGSGPEAEGPLLCREDR